MSTDLEQLRKNLSLVDQQFMELLAQRMEIVDTIKVLKKEHSIASHQPCIASKKSKEFEAYAKRHEQSKESYQKLYKCLHDISLNFQKK
ncbi:MAG: chorismate mutase [Bacteroidia bacterium]